MSDNPFDVPLQSELAAQKQQAAPVYLDDNGNPLPSGPPQQQPQGALSRFGSVLYHEAADPLIAPGKAASQQPRDSTEHLLNLVAGPGALPAYRLAKQLVDSTKAAISAKETVAQARSNFKAAQAKYDTANQLQMSALSHDPDLLNAKTLTNRLTKFNVTGAGGSASRSEQAVGADHAANLIEHAKTAQYISKLPATESKALSNRTDYQHVFFPSRHD